MTAAISTGAFRADLSLQVPRTPVQAEAEEEMRSLCVPGTEGEQEAKLEGAMKEQLRVPVMLGKGAAARIREDFGYS